MCTHFPVVKILRGNQNMIILEGPNKDVQSGATKLYELTRKVKEKRVKLPADLITFIKSSGVISKYQTRFQQSLRNPVALEVGSDLVLSSLSSDALDEALAAVLGDMSVEIVTLQSTAAVSPDLDSLKEILIKAKNEENSQEFRVDFSFIPGISQPVITKVRIVGYSENVNKLKEVLHDYQINHAETEVINNISSELVDCFHKILDLIGLKENKVTLKTSNVPHPSVFVSGPHCLVQEVQADLNAKLASLSSDTLVLDGPGAQRYFQSEGKITKELVESSCQVIIREKVYSPDMNTKPQSISNSTPILPRLSITRGHCNFVGSMAVNKTRKLEIKLGRLEDEQVNVLVVPMLNKGLTSTKIGKCLLKKAGSQSIRRNFDLMAAKCTLAPGDILQLEGHPSLGCSKIYFIECLPWDGVRGQSVQALGNGLKRCLDLCVQQGWCSVAFPVIGPGIVLKYPLREATQVLTDKIHQFGLSASAGSLSTIHIVIKPDYPDSEECYSDVYRRLIVNKADQVIFTSLSSDLDEISMTVGSGVKLQLVFGDITKETTDAVVNTTDFSDFQSDSVSKDILNKAGPQVEAFLKIGVGGLDPDVVALAILQGVKTATASSPLHFLTNIRLVLIKINVFLAFKHQTTQMFPRTVINTVTQLLRIPQKQSMMSINGDINTICTSSTSQQKQSVFLFLGLCKKNVEDGKTKLKDLYLAHCSTKTFMKEQLEDLTKDDMKNLKEQVESAGLYIQRDEFGLGRLTVSGLKHGVNQVMQMISTITPLRRKMRVKEEEDLNNRVSWCILGHSKWERLPKTANFNLENKDIEGGMIDAQGISWSVDLQRMEANRKGTAQMAKLKRLENLPDLIVPLDWDNMSTGENLKVVKLEHSSAEYQTVKKAFRRTVTNAIVKIERVQNLHLLHTYEMHKKYISSKNVLQSRAVEKLLYHGTTQDNCDSIMHTGFNRSFAGQNATAYGHGTYFAVSASYSASPTYARPAADGSRLMFVARVLTGSYTRGHSAMKVPPPRNDQRPHDHYDSVVDNIDNPNMYVVFHDSQAYPDYLITFS